ncbi:hypothetical protein B0H11DRAFT_1314307 [Mycena galericulata]|nr:hypothetical protein B0H11DRAFT_1314307 [Mycena galericulata]
MFSGATNFMVSGGEFNMGQGNYSCVDRPTLRGAATTFRHLSHFSFDVLLPTDTFLLTSGSGRCSSGNVKISTSTEVVGIVKVLIAVHYLDASALEETEISLIDRTVDDARVERGVSILPSVTASLYFDVLITLPPDVYIDQFSTNVPNFSHHLTNLDHISLGELSLSGSNGDINITILAAEMMTLVTSRGTVSVECWVGSAAVVRTSNAGIFGVYFAAESLNLKTTNGHIDVDVTVEANDNEAKNITMQTTNMALDSNIKLNTSSGRGGHFEVQAKTSNGRLGTQVASLPHQSVLALEATTSNAEVFLTMPSEYQGNFQLWSSNSGVPLVHEGSPHSARTLERTWSSPGTAHGKVYWRNKNSMPPGMVTLRTCNASAAIYF